MTDAERIEIFINSFEKNEDPTLAELERYAKETNVPIIRPAMQSFLKMMITLHKPARILEVGTAIGFSALLMLKAAPKDCSITTIENYEKRIPLARENFKKAGVENRITLMEGDAKDILKTLNGQYDLVFMDAAKGQYLSFLDDAKRLLRPGGLLISDNVLMDGVVMDSRFAVVRRDRTIHERMREYLYELKNDPELVTDILPIGDGASVSVKVLI